MIIIFFAENNSIHFSYELSFLNDNVVLGRTTGQMDEKTDISMHVFYFRCLIYI